MQGIYCFTNIINNKKYIGQSVHIEIRKTEHLSCYNNPDKIEICPKFYRALNKYGKENFSFEVLEEVLDANKLTEREDYWIRYYNSVDNGYNCIYPLDSLKGENNPHSVLSLNNVHEIRDLLRNSKMSVEDIASKFTVNVSTIYSINKGRIWYDSSISYPIRTWNILARKGKDNGRGKFTDEEVIEIRKRYVNEGPSQIYLDYADKYSKSGFFKVLRGETYKHLPIYNKNSKT